MSDCYRGNRADGACRRRWRTECPPAMEELQEIPIQRREQSESRRNRQQYWRLPQSDQERCERQPGDRCVDAGAPAHGEVIGQGSGLGDQAAPRNGSAKDVGVDQRGEAPALQMRCLDVGARPNTISGPPQPKPELDVFNRGNAVRLIEATSDHEDIPPDDTTPRPERRRLAPAALV